METKEYILTNATELLNRQGASPTSLRQVAAYLDMSDGNLRYHFKNKETLILAIFMQMMQEVEAATDALENTSLENLLEEVRKQLRTIFFTMYRYKFLFIEANLLFKQYASFRLAFKEMMKARKAYFFRFFEENKAKGYFNDSLSDKHYEMLFEQLSIISDNWINYVELERTTPSSIDKKIDHYIDLCLMLLGTVVIRE